MTTRALFALLIGKTTNTILKTTGRGATAAPGHYALKIDPHLLKSLAKNLDKTVIITGTNGKTTTSRFISDILEKAGRQIVHNRSGSNLNRGLTSTLIQNYPIKPHTSAIFEVDEATIPEVLEQVTPDLLLVNNLFRDQLDRYGEVAKIHSLWKEALKKLPAATTVILNSDDPNVADLGRDLKAAVVYFGINDPKIASKLSPHTIDARVCPLDHQALQYNYFYLAHLGSYQCSNGDFKNPAAQIKAENINLLGLGSSVFTLDFHREKSEITLPVSGIYNIYNALAAASLAHELGVPTETIKAGLNDFKAVFGRQETLRIGTKTISLNLVKNPVGYNEVLRLLKQEKQPLNLLLCLNDNLADGTDVSWIWDVDFEQLATKVFFVTASGSRALDLANRVKYAQIINGEALIEEDIEKALKVSLKELGNEDTLFILPTYTAMLKLQKILAREGYTEAFWKN